MRRLWFLCALTAGVVCIPATALALDVVASSGTQSARVAGRVAAPSQGKRRRSPTTKAQTKNRLFGNAAVGARSIHLRAGVAEAFPSHVPVGGIVRSVRAYVASHDSAKALIVGIYSSKHGRPANRLASGSLVFPARGRWDRVAVKPTSIDAGRIYWIALLGKGGALVVRGRRSGHCASEVSRHKRLTSLPSVWKGDRHSATCPISAFVTGTPRSTAPTTTGAGSPGTHPVAPPTTASGGSGACPASVPNTAGGPDPWRGCFPGPGNTGVPANVAPVDVSGGHILPSNPAIPADNTGWSVSGGVININTPNAVVDGVQDLHGVYLQNSNGGTIMNSYIGDVNQNTTGGNLLVQNDTINGGGDSSFSPVNSGTGTSTIDVEGVNAYNGKDGIHCLGTCAVRNSWLHDNVSNDPTAHQQGIYLNGGDNDVFTHNSIGCISETGCTANVAILNAGDDVNITVSKNLLLESPPSLNGEETGYCAYPGPNASSEGNKVSGIAWTDNVFQKGPNGKCALNGPVYGWYASICSPAACTWSGNIWDDGTALNEPNR